MNICISCGHKTKKFLLINNNHSLYKCSNCDLVSTKGKQEIHKISENYHRDYEYEDNKELFTNIFLKKYYLISKYFSKPKTMLEIGSSQGYLLDIFKINGWKVSGIEPSKSGKSMKNYVINKNFEEVDFNKKFDLIVLNHTLEHMRNPFNNLKKINKILKKDGILFIDVPNVESFRSKIMGRIWPYLLPDEHLFHFSRKSLKIMAERNNFKLINFYSRSGIFEFQNPLKELIFSFIKLKKRFFSYLFNFPLDLLSTLAKSGDSMTLLFIKK